MGNWCSSNAYSDFQTVQADVNQISTDVNNQNLSALPSDGATIAQDANTANQDTMPPFSRMHVFEYKLYLSYMSLGGLALSQGDYSKAASLFSGGTAPFNDVKALISNGCGTS
jgi:hypothetical protein